MKSVAIIGSGISGLSSAYLLRKKYKVHLYEKASYFGGHSNTIDLSIDGKSVPVDTGFIVFNHRTYPNLLGLFQDLNIITNRSDMSFGVTLKNKSLEYSGSSIGQFFAQKKNMFKHSFLKMGFDILTFNKAALKATDESLKGLTLENFISLLGLSQYFRDHYLYPMAGAIWSTSSNKVGDFPAQTFIRFFKNHGLLTITDHPQWYSVKGGSRQYVNKIIAHDGISSSLSQNIKSISRDNDKVILKMNDDSKTLYDHIIFATPAHKTLSLLADATPQERRTLNAFKYSENKAYVHSDVSLMPKNKKAWASWVYSDQAKTGVNITYWMNNLQNLRTDKNIFVTLNPKRLPKEDITYRVLDYEHPIFDQDAIEAQAHIHKLQGNQQTYFTGAYQRYGFHEDGIWSAVNVAKLMGIKIPWE